MRTLVQKPEATQEAPSAKSSTPVREHVGLSREVNSTLRLQRTIGNRAVRRMLRTRREGLDAGLAGTTSPRPAHDFSRPPTRPRPAVALQTKLTISEPGDQYEQEADRVSEQVMRMESPDTGHAAPPSIQRLGTGFQEGLASKHLRRLCTECEEGEELHRAAAPAGADVGSDEALRKAEAKIDAVSGGQPLTDEQRGFFEPRFGADFSRVRIHVGGSADTAARAVGALAFTRGSDIVFREDQYHPHTFAGRRLLAHELTHVVQQGAAPDIQQRSAHGSGETHVRGGGVLRANHLVQCFPGDGMVPPGDCAWTTYLPLRAAVESAKAVVSMLGACSPGDSCIFLATKIAAITAEIAARVALDATCFRGGDTGHRRQVLDKVNMVNRCYRFFSNSNCPPQLVAAMAVVVERARAVITAAAAAVAVALVVALIAAIIALVEVIAALLAAAAAAVAEASAAAAAVAAVIALLVMVRDYISPNQGPPDA